MKKFLLKIATYIVITVGIMALLDVAYTKIYENRPARSKFQYLRSLSNQKIDYAFLGSSRVDNFIVPNLILEKTGKSAANLGFQASKPNDIWTVLQLLKAYNIQTRHVYAQMDYAYNINGHSNIMEYEMIPFIRDNTITRNHYDYRNDRFALYYVPFYRYGTFDYKIGFREVFMNLIKKPSHITQNRGYNALFGDGEFGRTDLPVSIEEKNLEVDSISAFALKNNTALDYFFSPVHPKVKNQHFAAKLKTKLPLLLDYSKAIQDEAAFKNYFHLNDVGAKAFTQKFIDDQLKK